MSNGFEVNNEFERRVLAILGSLSDDQKNANQYIMSRLEKIDDLDRKLQEVNKRIEEVEKTNITQNANVQNNTDKVKDINTIIRWAVMVVIGAVILAVLNLVILSDNPPSFPINPTNTSDVSYMYREEGRNRNLIQMIQNGAGEDNA